MNRRTLLFIIFSCIGILLLLGILSFLFFSRDLKFNEGIIEEYVVADDGGIGGGPEDTSSSWEGTAPSGVDSYDRSATSDQLINDSEGSKIRKSGSVSFLVENIDDAVDSMKIVNGKYSGEITNISDYGRGNDRVVQITSKVPVSDFESYYEELREIEGEITSANVSTTDVTEEYIDITSRLANLKNTEAQLNKVLERADTVTDILAVQRELNTVRGNIESYEQRKRYFDSQTDYSYMTVTFSVDKTGLNVTEDEWKPWGEFKAAIKSLLGVLKGFVNLIIWLIVFSPLVLIPFFGIKYIIKRRKAKNSVKMV